MEQAPLKWNLTLLGKFSLTDGRTGQEISLSTQKVRLLLAYVALRQGEWIPRLVVSQAIWPESERKAARDSLRTALSNLKNVVPNGAIRANRQEVRLEAGWLECDAHEGVKGTECESEFMPGFEADWVIEERMRRRELLLGRVLDELSEASMQGDLQRTLVLAEKATRIDPFDERAGIARVRALEQLGRRDEAERVATSFRKRSLRELGYIPDVMTSAPVHLDSPVAAAALWLLDRNPSEAVSLLAGTPTEWLNLPLDFSLDVHTRALLHGGGGARERGIVRAQRFYLLVLTGRLKDAGAVRDELIAMHGAQKNWEMIGRIRYAEGFFHLSQGAFPEAFKAAQSAVDFAKLQHSAELIAEFIVMQSTILVQLGMIDQARKVFLQSRAYMETVESLPVIAQFNLGHLDFCLDNENFEEAETHLREAKRLFAASGCVRMEPWVRVGYASLHLAVGDALSAKRELEAVKRLGKELGGQAVTAQTDDLWALTSAKLGELDDAAEAVARANVYRRGCGSVRSVLERQRMRSVRKLLKDSLKPADLERAYQRARTTVEPVRSSTSVPS